MCEKQKAQIWGEDDLPSLTSPPWCPITEAGGSLGWRGSPHPNPSHWRWRHCGRQWKGNQILLTSLSHLDHSNPETHAASGLSSFRSQNPPLIVQVGLIGFSVTWDCKHNPLESNIHLLCVLTKRVYLINILHKKSYRKLKEKKKTKDSHLHEDPKTLSRRILNSSCLWVTENILFTLHHLDSFYLC